MKVRPSVKPICEKCKIIKRRQKGHFAKATQAGQGRSSGAAARGHIPAAGEGMACLPWQNDIVCAGRPDTPEGMVENMARIAGVDLPKDKRVEIGATYIYGIGRSRARYPRRRQCKPRHPRKGSHRRRGVQNPRVYRQVLYVEGNLRQTTPRYQASDKTGCYRE